MKVWRRKRQPTSVFLPGESHGQKSLAGCSPWGHRKMDTTEHTHMHANGKNYGAAAAAPKLLQSWPTLCDPIDGSPPGSPIPGFSRQEHWSGLPFPSPMHASESEVSQSYPTLSNPMSCSPPGSSVHEAFPGKSTGVGCKWKELWWESVKNFLASFVVSGFVFLMGARAPKLVSRFLTKEIVPCLNIKLVFQWKEGTPFCSLNYFNMNKPLIFGKTCKI